MIAAAIVLAESMTIPRGLGCIEIALVNLRSTWVYAQVAAFAQQYLRQRRAGRAGLALASGRVAARALSRPDTIRPSRGVVMRRKLLFRASFGGFMFTRSSAAEPKPLEPVNNTLGLNVQRRPPAPD